MSDRAMFIRMTENEVRSVRQVVEEALTLTEVSGNHRVHLDNVLRRLNLHLQVKGPATR